MRKYLIATGVVLAYFGLVGWGFDHCAGEGNVEVSNVFYYMMTVPALSTLVLGVIIVLKTWMHNWKYSQHGVEIKEGKRWDIKYFFTRLWWAPGITTMKYRVKFSRSGSAYPTNSPVYLEAAWNKLPGLYLFHVHNESARVGWRYNRFLGKMEICSYNYTSSGLRAEGEPQLVAYDLWCTIEIDLEEVLGRKLKWYEKVFIGKAGIMFGGKLKSPVDIDFEFQML